MRFILHRAAYSIEDAFVILLESALRIAQRLHPRLYIQELRVRRISDGYSCKATGKFVILVVYAESSLPSFTTNLIAAIRNSPFDLVIVSNGPLDRPAAEQLLDHCRLLIERVNVGRDFGGYKDGIDIVSKRFPNIDRLVVANDSVFYLSDGLDKLLADLDGNEDFIGVSEVFDHHYHIASFLISFGPGVLRSSAFRRFWRRYRPIDTRRWAIFRGEGALTAKLLGAGFRPHVLFRAERLRSHLQTGCEREVAEIISLLPSAARKSVAAAVKGASPLERSMATAGGGMNETAVDGEPNNLADAVIAAIMARNQMHMGGFLFRRFLGLPLVKRDVFFREIYAFGEIDKILADLEGPLRDEILADIRRRGSAASFGPFRRILYRHSAA